jgi:GntR family transcriptional regulator
MIQETEVRYLEIILDFRSKIPLANQVQEKIRGLILNNSLQPGDPLPTVRSLANQLNVNFNTIARAYRALDQEGWIYTHQGRGNQVAERDEITAENIQVARDHYLADLVNQTLALAAQAGISIHQLRAEIDRRMTISQIKPARPNKSRFMILKRRPHISNQRMAKTTQPPGKRKPPRTLKINLAKKTKRG